MTKKQGAAVAAASSQLPASVDADLAAEMLANADHAQTFDADQLTIPRIVLLQDLSPEVKERDGAYVPGARPGLILNKLKKQIDDTIQFVPAVFSVRYIAWRPRKEGGGLIDQNLTLQEVEENFERDGIGRWIGVMAPRNREDAPVRVEVIQTAEWIGLARGQGYDWSPVAIAFAGTKSKVARDLNTTIELARMEVDGKRFKPAAFFHQFRLGTFLDRSGDDEFFNYTVTHEGWCLDPQVRAEGKALKVSFESGEASVSAEGL